MAKRIALVAGATGLVGRECLRLLVEDDNIRLVPNASSGFNTIVQ